jgi:DNA methylase
MVGYSREGAKGQTDTRAPKPAVNHHRAISLTMAEAHLPPLLRLPPATEAALIAGACDTEPVKGLTHGFYKYPARFSPVFVRAVIETFTRPGDLVLDNHVGGGTTLVEALVTGRHAIGVDISPLAEFVARVKTTVFSEAELDRLDAWAKRVREAIDIHKPSVRFPYYAELGYYKHLDHPSRWRLRKAIEQGLGAAIRLTDKRLESFGRCAVLRTSQWALDGRKKLPTVSEFKEFLEWTAIEMVGGARALRSVVKANGRRPIVEIINRNAAGIEDDERLLEWRAPRLVLTSPPYPGGARALSPLAGRRPQGSAAPIHDRKQARRRRRELLHDGRPKISGA